MCHDSSQAMENNITYPVVMGYQLFDIHGFPTKSFKIILFTLVCRHVEQVERTNFKGCYSPSCPFHVGSYDSISGEITEVAIAASVNFVGLCCQQTAYMAGRGDINEDIQIIKASMFGVHESFWSMYVQLHIMYRHNQGD